MHLFDPLPRHFLACNGINDEIKRALLILLDLLLDIIGGSTGLVTSLSALILSLQLLTLLILNLLPQHHLLLHEFGPLLLLYLELIDIPNFIATSK